MFPGKFQTSTSQTVGFARRASRWLGDKVEMTECWIHVNLPDWMMKRPTFCTATLRILDGAFFAKAGYDSDYLGRILSGAISVVSEGIGLSSIGKEKKQTKECPPDSFLENFFRQLQKAQSPLKNPRITQGFMMMASAICGLEASLAMGQYISAATTCAFFWAGAQSAVLFPWLGSTAKDKEKKLSRSLNFDFSTSQAGSFVDERNQVQEMENPDTYNISQQHAGNIIMATAVFDLLQAALKWDQPGSGWQAAAAGVFVASGFLQRVLYVPEEKLKRQGFKPRPIGMEPQEVVAPALER
jgi:hypothetical protein